MLKIKDNLDLKKLEKYGFKEERWGYIYYPNYNSPKTRYYSSIKISKKLMGENNVIEFCLENMSVWCNSIEELENDFKNIKASYEAFKIKIDDLIKDGLVEKID